ncbi:membrane carboxypeptidase [endosymbiont of Acanthamoeba sp. UWC8]|uniref:transglycosylase domain-containing protein n=1 Tax=endosymbiont of Acanthamoeba sp. UWC8 TaxID=86106 RepID=UPI0004D0F1A3|nr:PBP1A family penicillin-binding protein [endosymbiont of Acanthamoeba sp. UWC8]AIF81748.1 membrane carboxypeptidase [endosymbiont of Acanthamoeba sp. UWC8]
MTKKKKPYKKKASGKKSIRKRAVVLLLKVGFVISLICASLTFLIIAYYSSDLPNIAQVYEFKKQPSFTVLDRNGRILANYGDLQGRDLKFEQIPKTLIQAVVAIEDRRFFDHNGVDIWGIIRAVYRNKKAGKVVQGGSTITQQLAKIAFLTPEKTFKRKIQEALIAIKLEKKYSKKEIIRIYLNRVYLGKGNFGVDAAAKFYFGKYIEKVSLYEAAILAGMLKAPSKYAPANNHELSIKRAKQVLSAMEEENYITHTDIKKAIPPLIMERGNSRGALQNPYFSDYVIEQLPLYITANNQDIKIYTTLDLNLQKKLEETILENMKNAKSKFNASEAAAVAINRRGEIVALVGGVSYNKSQFNRATSAKRQPGSAFKLFVYLTALENGYSKESIVIDSPIKINKWSPRNFNRQYLGEVVLEEAFAKSINTVAVKLSENLGREKVINTASKLGIKDKMKNLPSIALGSEVTSLLDLSGSYSVVANGGYNIKPYAVLKITDRSGKILYLNKNNSYKKVISDSANQQIKHMLAKVIQNGTGKKAHLAGTEVFGKTGTTQDYRDACFIGFTDYLTVGVWVGNDDNTSMKRVMGGGLPAEIWRGFMKKNVEKSHGTIWKKVENTGNEKKSNSIMNFLSSVFSKKEKGETIDSIIEKNTKK